MDDAEKEEKEREDDGPRTDGRREVWTNTEDTGSLLSLVVGIRPRDVRSREVLSRLRGSSQSIVQPAVVQEERCIQTNGSSLVVNLSDSRRTITLETIESEARIDVMPENGSSLRAPPSYTSMGGSPIAVLPSQPSPPPSYERAVGIRYLTEDIPFIAGTTSTGIWGHRQQAAYCRRCNAMVLTETLPENCCATHLSALASCIFMCWPCAFLPYVLTAFKNVFHLCPACHTLLGKYHPFPLGNVRQ